MHLSTLILAFAACERGYDPSAAFPAVISEGDTQLDQDTESDETSGPGGDGGPGGGGPGDGGTTGDDTEGGDTGGGFAERAPSIVQFDGPAPRNVVMISIDTLRRDALSYYAGEDRDTPVFDRLLEEGVSLDRHRSCSNWTYASALCALSGQDNLDMGFIPVAGEPTDEQQIPTDIAILATILDARGYQTSLASTNPYIGATYGYDAHYDEVWDGGGTHAVGEDVAAAGLDAAARFQTTGDPWFVHMHFLEPHTPYQPPAEYIEGADTVLGFNLKTPAGVDAAEIAYADMTPTQQAQLRDYAQRMYAGEVRGMDDLLEAVLDELSLTGALDDALVVIWTDHGEQLWDRKNLTHGKDLHSEEVDAVAAFWAKNIVPVSVTQPTAHRDIVPTLLHAMGWRDDRERIGRALSAESEDVPVLSMRLRADDTMQSIDQGDLRMIFHWTDGVEVYDLAADPGEQVDILDRTDAEQYALWQVLEGHVDRLDRYNTANYDGTVQPQIPSWIVK